MKTKKQAAEDLKQAHTARLNALRVRAAIAIRVAGTTYTNELQAEDACNGAESLVGEMDKRGWI